MHELSMLSRGEKMKYLKATVGTLLVIALGYLLVGKLAIDENPLEVEGELYQELYKEMEISKLDDYKYPEKEESYHKELKKVEQGERPKGYTPKKYFNIQVNERLDMESEEYSKVFKEIRLDDLEKEDGIVYVGRKTCPYCNILVQRFRPVLEQLGLSVKYIDTDELNDIGIEKLKDVYGLEFVPMVYLVKDGKVERALDGRTMYMDYTDIARQLVASFDYIMGDSETIPLSSEVNE